MEGEIQKTKQAIVPNHKELLAAKKQGIPILTWSPYAVYVLKMVSTKWKDITDKGNIPEYRIVLDGLHKDFNRNILVDPQFAEGTKLNQGDLDFLEAVQQTKTLEHMTMVEPEPLQKSDTFERQLKGWISRNKGKKVIPLLEVYSDDIQNKILAAKKNGCRLIGVKFRSFKRYSSELKMAITLAKAEGLECFVFGVSPRMWKPSSASMLLPPLCYGANYVANWVAYSGGRTNPTLLNDEWVFEDFNTAKGGLMDYNGASRIDLLKGNNPSTFVGDLQKVDTINQACLNLTSKGTPSEQAMIRLFE